MKSIKNYNQLFNKIYLKYQESTLLNCFDILNKWDLNIEEFDIRVSKGDVDYRKMLLNKNEDIDMYLIIWNMNAKTPIHDHSPNGCLFKVIQGKLKETLYDTADIKTSKAVRMIDINHTGYLHNSIGYHKVENVHDGVSLSIHLYSPADYKTNYY